MRRKLLQLDDISNYQKINQIFSHEININDKIRKVTHLDNISNDKLLKELLNVRQYRFKYVFIPPRGKNIVINSANLMKYGFFYSANEKYEYLFTNPIYELLVYIPLTLEYYIKVHQTIWQKQFKEHIDLKYSICSLKKEEPLLIGDLYHEFQDINMPTLYNYYFNNIFENEFKLYIDKLNIRSSQQYERLFNDKEIRYKLYNIYKENHLNDIKFKCRYLINDPDNALYATINENKGINKKLLINIQSKIQSKIQKAKNTFFAILLLRQLKEAI